MSTVTRRCYQMITVATSEDVMLFKLIATKNHSSNEWFGGTTEEPL
jgi:hypothetical protein